MSLPDKFDKSRFRTLMFLLVIAVVGGVLIILVMVAPWKKSPSPAAGSYGGQTSITRSLNDQIKEGTGLYTGGKGILVRTPDRLDGSDKTVVPATFWVNDIKTPSQLRPSGDPLCPHGGSDGYRDLSGSKCNHANGPWDFASVSVVMGVDAMGRIMKDFGNIQRSDWAWGVFYATDANSVDSRCRWIERSNGWDCPGFWVNMDGSFRADENMKGAGFYSQGNPTETLGGGGAGCHGQPPTASNGWIDQVDAFDSQKQNLVQDFHCQCNRYFRQDWTAWVQDWIDNNQQKAGFEWRAWLHGRGKAPSWAVDSASCWVSNPRDMIAMQNAIYAARGQWNNGLTPLIEGSQRRYWGWNEVPVTRTLANNPQMWDAVMIKLPAQLCGGRQDHIGCLGAYEQQQLEEDLQSMVNNGHLVPGKAHITTRPGSYMVVVREFKARADEYQRQFYCENWVSPSRKFQLVFQADEAGHEFKVPGACYLDKGNSTLIV